MPNADPENAAGRRDVPWAVWGLRVRPIINVHRAFVSMEFVAVPLVPVHVSHAKPRKRAVVRMVLAAISRMVRIQITSVRKAHVMALVHVWLAI